jgi:hypothetical protein
MDAKSASRGAMLAVVPPGSLRETAKYSPFPTPFTV